jgi:membrane-bound acyltransferase YfiQ involved in biofilm formation
MKTFALVISLIVFMVSAYFFLTDFSLSTDSNHLIYMSLLLVLMLVCIVGILINIPLIMQEKKRVRLMVYNRFSRRQSGKKIRVRFQPS